MGTMVYSGRGETVGYAIVTFLIKKKKKEKSVGLCPNSCVQLIK